VADGVRAERWADGAFFEILDRGGKRAGTQHQAEIVGFLLAELSLRSRPCLDAAINDGGGLHPVLEDYSQLFADILLVKDQTRPASVESVKSTS